MITATLRDSTKVNTRKVFEMYVSGSYHKVVTLDAKKFAKNFLELEIGRHGNTITFHIATINSMTGDGRNIKSTGVYNAHTSIAPNTVIDGLTTTAWAYDTGKADTMYWTNLEFDWVNVEYWHDIPNRFQDGDVLTVDTYDHSVMLNGVEVNDLQAVDNDWDSFALDPGSTDIEIVTSSWATATTDASIKIREAYV